MKKLMLVLSLVVFFAAYANAQQNPDPQSLVGEWVGDYTASGEGTGMGGKVYLTVKRIEGNRIYGDTQISSSFPNATRQLEGANEGTLDGNIIRWTKNQRWGEFTVNGKRMTGFLMSPMRTDVILTKTK